MRLSKERCEYIDNILKDAMNDKHKSALRAIKTTDDLELYNEVADMLYNYGYCGRKIGGGIYSITQDGIKFYLNGGFTSQYEKERKEKEIQESTLQLTKKKINAAKREPYLIVWGVVTTIISITLACLQYFSK